MVLSPPIWKKYAPKHQPQVSGDRKSPQKNSGMKTSTYRRLILVDFGMDLFPPPKLFKEINDHSAGQKVFQLVEYPISILEPHWWWKNLFPHNKKTIPKIPRGLDIHSLSRKVPENSVFLGIDDAMEQLGIFLPELAGGRYSPSYRTPVEIPDFCENSPLNCFFFLGHTYTPEK